MGNSFLKSASKQVQDVRTFLRDSAGGNSIKYAAEKGAKHIIYIPYQESAVVDEDGNQTTVKSIIAINGAIHEWTTSDGKFKAVACLKDVIRHEDDDDPSSPLINDGTCPFCENISNAWDIYRYRKEMEEANCKLTGEQRKQHLEKVLHGFSDERKAKEPRNYMYILVVKFRLNESGNPIIGEDKLPEYDLKVMKLSASRVEKIQQQVANSGSELPDSELIFEYPNADDRRLLVSQSTTAPVFPQNKMVAKYPALLDKINEDVSKFEWDGITKSFQEWSGMTSAEANTVVDNMFEQWNKYKLELKTNPQAKYLEYVVETPTSTPNITGNGIDAVAGAIPTVPVVPTAPAVPVVPTVPVANATAPTVPVVPTAPVPNATPTAPTVPVTPNDVFASGAAPAAPVVPM